MKPKLHITLVGLLATAALIVSVQFFTKDRSFSICTANISDIFVQDTAKVCLTMFRNDCGRYPTTAEGLNALVVCPLGLEGRWRGPYIDARNSEPPKDPWGRKYLYTSPGIKNKYHYDLWSLGPSLSSDRDDIANWK